MHKSVLGSGIATIFNESDFTQGSSIVKKQAATNKVSNFNVIPKNYRVSDVQKPKMSYYKN